MASTVPSQPPILLLVPNELLCEIFSWVGPIGTARCSVVCRTWNSVLSPSFSPFSSSSQTHLGQALWKYFVEHTFGLKLEDIITLTKTSNNNNGNYNNNTKQAAAASTAVVVDWRNLYYYLAQKAREEPQLLGGNDDNNSNLSVVFADDGGHIPGYAPQNAIRANNRAWCTNDNVEHNVDLLLKFPDEEPCCLVSGFAIRNGGYYFSAPLAEALVFGATSSTFNKDNNDNNNNYLPYDLKATQYYNNDQAGRELVEKLEGRRASFPSFLEEEDSEQTSSMAHPKLSLAPPTFNYDFPGRWHSAGTSSSSSSSPSPPPPTPLAAFKFSPIPIAYKQRLVRRCPPTVCRWIHFKLLSSFNPPSRPSNNIDVMDLHTFGVPLPEFSSFIHHRDKEQKQEKEDNHDKNNSINENISRATNHQSSLNDYCFERQHPVRPYLYPNFF